MSELISWKYKSVERVVLGSVVVELFEWCSKYHVRLYGTGENFVDVSISQDLHQSRHIYESIKLLVKQGMLA